MRRQPGDASPLRSKVVNSNLFLCFMWLSVFLGGCATTAPEVFSRFKNGEWNGKVLIKNKRESRSSIVNIKVKAIDGEKLRIDITSTMGSHLASFLLVGEQLEYLNIIEKTAYKGRATRESLREIFLIPIEPQVFYNILFDKNFENKNWSCAVDVSSRLMTSCKELKTGLSISWVSRDGSKRTVGFEHPSASIQMSLYDFESKVSEPQKVFQLKTPPSFKIKK